MTIGSHVGDLDRNEGAQLIGREPDPERVSLAVDKAIRSFEDDETRLDFDPETGMVYMDESVIGTSRTRRIAKPLGSWAENAYPEISYSGNTDSFVAGVYNAVNEMADAEC